MTCPHTLDAAKRIHDRYDRAQIARHRLMVPRQWEALEKNDPQPGEAWLVLLPWNRSLKGVIPAIKTATAWMTDPAYLREPDADGGYLPESAVIPLERVVEAPATGDTE